MRVDLVLCEAAKADPGSAKVHMLGAGWNLMTVVAGRSSGRHSVVAFFHIPWNEPDRPRTVTFSLVDEDGAAVHVPQARTGEPMPVQYRTDLVVRRSPAHRPGTDVIASVVFDVGSGLPLAAGCRYEWVCRTSGEYLARATFQAIDPVGS
jgi:hypothetical protein